MTHRCVVIEDEKPARDKLKRLLAEHPDFELVGEAGDATEAVRLIDEQRPDLCLLDVQMPEGTGFDVLQRARHAPRVIFTTAYDEYAVRAFEVRSLDYLLKPVSRARFAEALDRARQAFRGGAEPAAELLAAMRELGRELGRRRSETPAAGAAMAEPPRRISARKGARIVMLDAGDVLYFEADETLVFARTAAGRFLVERTLAELESLFERDFFRAHRAFLVRVDRIAEIVPGEAGTCTLILADEPRTRIPLSRRQARRLRERIPW